LDVGLGIYSIRIGMFLARRPNVWASQETEGEGAFWLLEPIIIVLLVIGRVELNVGPPVYMRTGGAERRPPCIHETSGMLKQGHGETSKDTHSQEVTNIWKEPRT
jgi:hypothetical protein